MRRGPNGLFFHFLLYKPPHPNINILVILFSGDTMKKKKVRILVIDKFTIFVVLFAIMFVLIVLSRIAFSSNILPEPENHLKGRVIIIDPGHGGVDGGASSGHVLEKNINLETALAVQSMLRANGAKTILTRGKDISLENLFNSGESRYKRDLNARVNIINNNNADLFISIHANYMPGNSLENGTMIFYRIKESPSHTLASCILSHINNIECGSFKRSPHSPQIGDYYILRNCRIPGAIIETGFISNPSDLFLLRKDDFRHKLAWAICLGINDYFRTR